MKCLVHETTRKDAHSMMWGYYYDNPAMMVWMVVQSVFWLALVGFAVWAFVRWLNRSSHRTTSTSTPPTTPSSASPLSALDILQQRYARGEIDAATFEDMRARLSASAPSAPSATPPYDPSRDPVTSGR